MNSKKCANCDKVHKNCYAKLYRNQSKPQIPWFKILKKCRKARRNQLNNDRLLHCIVALIQKLEKQMARNKKRKIKKVLILKNSNKSSKDLKAFVATNEEKKGKQEARRRHISAVEVRGRFHWRHPFAGFTGMQLQCAESVCA